MTKHHLFNRLLALALATGTLIGCGKNGDAISTADQAATTSKQESQ